MAISEKDAALIEFCDYVRSLGVQCQVISPGLSSRSTVSMDVPEARFGSFMESFVRVIQFLMNAGRLSPDDAKAAFEILIDVFDCRVTEYVFTSADRRVDAVWKFSTDERFSAFRSLVIMMIDKGSMKKSVHLKLFVDWCSGAN